MRGNLNQLADQTRARIERDCAAGHLTSDCDPAALADALVWSTEHVLYVGLAGIAPALDTHERLVEALVTLWAGTLEALQSR